MSISLDDIKEAVAPVAQRCDTLELALAAWSERNAEAKARVAALQVQIRETLAGVTPPDLQGFENAAKARRADAMAALVSALSNWGHEPKNATRWQIQASMAGLSFPRIHDVNDLFNDKYPGAAQALGFILAGLLTNTLKHVLPEKPANWQPHVLYKLAEVLEVGQAFVTEAREAKEQLSTIATWKAVNLNTYAAAATAPQYEPLSIEDFEAVFGKTNGAERHRVFHINRGLCPDAQLYTVSNAYDFKKAQLGAML